MKDKGSITLSGKSHDAGKGIGVYLGPNEGATITAAPGETLKVFHIVVPRIPQ